MKHASRILPIVALFFCLALIVMTQRSMSGQPEAVNGYNYDQFSRVAVMDRGRVMPLDTLARNALMTLSGKQTLRHEGERIDAIRWLADVMAQPDVACDYACFRVDNPGVIGTAGLSPEEGHKGKYFTYAQLRVHRNHLHAQALLAEQVDGKKRSAYESALLRLEEQLHIYETLAWNDRPQAVRPGPGSPQWAAMPQTLSSMPVQWSMWSIVQEVKRRGLEGEAMYQYFEEQARRGQMGPTNWDHARLYSAYLSGDSSWQLTVQEMLAAADAPAGLALELERKRTVFAALDQDPSVLTIYDFYQQPSHTAEAEEWLGILLAYRSETPAQFNERLSDRRALVSGSETADQQRIDIEVAYNRLLPFLLAVVMNILAFLMTAGLLMFGPSHRGPWREGVWRSVMLVLGLALGVHTLGLVARIYIHGRPPVTNLYSSAVFLGWFAVASCFIVEWFSRRGIGALAASVIGAASLVVAHNLHLNQGGDTMGPMQAVLDSNFWLTTHVLTVTIGYAATFMAGVLAILYITLGLTTPILDKPTARLLTQMVYGTICFALFFSFIGTVLGGIWADQSWGRFWGWDPKENGAVMIVIMNAITLHVWFARMVKPRGLMALAVAGNIITAWSWFGTNLLGVGLHSYGFMSSARIWLIVFVLSQLGIMLIALVMPTRYWFSFRKPKAKADSRAIAGA